MFSVPDDTVHRSKIADWIELEAIASPDKRFGFGTLVSATELGEDEQEQNIADESAAEDSLVLRAQEEIERRLKNVGDDYPFRIDKLGRVLEFREPVTTVGAVYLFCLFLSHAFDRTVVSKAQAPRITNKLRDLFQAAATVAAGGFVEGPSISFGFPRPDGAGYLEIIQRVYKLFGDGKPRKKPRPAAAKKIKDNGIDVIAWTRSIDGLPCTLYLVAQVASGADWEDKSVTTDRLHFHKYWFTREPGSQPHDAMFMPFALEPEDPEDGTPYQEVLTDYMQSIGYRYGTLFYRDRIARHLADGLKLVAAGETEIERVADLTKIETWVSEYWMKLRAAA